MKAHYLPLWALLPVLAVLPAKAAPIISEFQADNNETLEDDDGASSDWIEIYNPDATAVSLEGMALTDDPLIPQKWLFPAVTLQARSRMLVWASVKNRTNPAAPLHTNFDLAAAGEYLALMAADGTTKLTEFNTYPPQPEDRSYGSTSEVVVTELLVASNASCKWLVPLTAAAGWETPAFADTSWTAAQMGIGYDNAPATDQDYNPLIGAGGNVMSAMFNKNASCYVRIPFTFNGVAAEVTSLQLRVRYEDGFAVFLNGTRLNPPTPATTNVPTPLAFNSSIGTARSGALAVTYSTFDISGQKNLLTNGPNLLAVQMVNAGSSSSDILMQAELEVTRVSTGGTPESGYFAKPTPSAANIVAPVDGFVEDVDFSVKRGIYTTAQTVALSTLTPGAAIRFTTNGSRPTLTNGLVYTTPLNISTSTVLRAAAFKTDWEPSRVKTHTYVFGEAAKNQPSVPAGYPSTWGNEFDFNNGTLTGPVVPGDYRMDPVITGNATYGPLIVNSITNTLPIVCISGNISEIFDFTNGIYCNARLTPGLEIQTSMEYFDPHSTENWQEDAGLRMHGGDAPVEHPKKPFRIYFRKEYGTGRLRHSMFPGSPVDSFDKLQLRPLGHDGWAVPFGSDNESLARHAMYCRDRFLRQTELDMGRLAHYGKYVHLFINGLYWGFYDIHEVQSKEYWADHKGGAEEDWDVLEHTNTSNPLVDAVDGSDASMLAALALVTPASNAANSATFDALGQYLDYDEFIDNCIVQMWGAQNDWMGPVFRGVPGVNLSDASRFFNKNWQAARRSRGPEPGKLFWQTWDAEISMGTSITSQVAFMRITDFNHTLIGTPTSDINHVPGTPGPAGVFWYALRKFNPAFRMRVADRLQRHFFNGGAMTTARNLARLQSFRDLLDLPIVAESARWGDVNTGNPVTVSFNRDDHWRSEMNWMRDTYIPTRNNTILTQMAAIGMWPAVTAPVMSQFGGSVPSGFQLSLSHSNGAGSTVYYTLDGSDPMSPLTGGETITLAGPTAGTTVFYKVPTSQYSQNSWKDLAAPGDINTWLQGPLGLGFDANTTFNTHFTTNVSEMQTTGTSLYVRVPFSVTEEQKATMTSLTLKLKYNDGAFIWLNAPGGTVQPLFRLNVSTTATPSYLSTALAERTDGDSIVYQNLDLTPQISTLNAGSNNLLSIQAVNLTMADDDFLCTPELVATTSPVASPTGTAIAYTGPFTLPQTGTVKARVLKNNAWSPLVEASFIVGQPANASNLVISEFNYNPVASEAEATAGFGDQDFEWIELMNISSGPVELTSCRFDDGITFDFSTNSSVQTLAAGARMVIASNAAAFAVRHPGVPVAGTFQSASNLSNGGERLELLAANGNPIFDFTYDDVSPWPTSPDAGGHSLVLINPQTDPDPAVAANWRASFAPGGSPGTSDADSYGAWATRNSITGDMSDDPEGNGLINLVEYALGLIPSTGETDGIFSAKFETLTIAGTPDTYLVLRFRRNVAADDIIVTPEMSTDMVTWTSLMNWDVPPVTTNPDGTESIACRSPQPISTAARVYVRVSVQTR